MLAEFFYLNLTDKLYSGRYQKENTNTVISYDSALFNKQKTGFHIKIGADINLFKRFDIDIYGGVGAAIRKFDYSNLVKPKEGMERIFVEWVPQNYLFEGETSMLHLTMGMKIGYLLWRNSHA